MSEPQQYISKPVTPTIYAFDGSVYAIDVGGETLLFKKPLFEALFQLLDIPAIEKQLEGHLASFVVNVTEYVDLCDHAQNAEELNAIRKHFNRCQGEHIAEVLRLFGLENKEEEVNR